MKPAPFRDPALAAVIRERAAMGLEIRGAGYPYGSESDEEVRRRNRPAPYSDLDWVRY